MADKKTSPTPEVHQGITERMAFYAKKVAEAFGVDEATVTDVVSGKKIGLVKRKKQIEQAGNDPGRWGVPIDLP